ncbi:hypothetical protein B0J13DRAFT_599129 [Dactylonectria estremocensis]|uniref:Uncharacterized protein n=1 Tax=Dactylonectria estremocensis TaxID=1079267 RepID=A0A9P9DQH2_9HYPO|nr:hypothetical protein B0J13DRAFT_599129 [Dactylonectria estremocensis]
MEAVGLTVGVVGLAGLFSTCLEAVDKVQTYLSFRTDSHVLDTRFKAAKVRFEKWGRRVGFEETMRSEDHHPALDDRDISAAVQDIFQIITTLCDASDASAHHTSRAMTPSDDVSLGSLRPRPHGTRRRKLVWTLWGKTERTDQVELFEKLVQQLHNLVPVDAVQGTRLVHELDTRRTDKLASGLGTSSDHAWPAELQRIIAQIEEANRAETRREIHSWLGRGSPNERYHDSVQKRLVGTCDWIFHRPAFQNWLDQEFPAGAKLLWINGPAGFGKTILCAHVVEHLSSTLKTPVAHFFFSSDLESREDPVVAVRSWISQVVLQHEGAFEHVRQKREADSDEVATRANAVMLFTQLLHVVPGCTFVVDGLDECTYLDDRSTSVTKFIETVKKAVVGTNTRVLVVSRAEPEIRTALTDDTPESFAEYEIAPDDVRSDTAAYSRDIVDRKLPNNSDDVRSTLSKAMTDQCEGQFLWLKMQEKSLRKGMNKKQLQHTIEETPAGLDQLYDRSWQRITQAREGERQRIYALLRWAAFALRPLTVCEVTEAILIDESEDLPIEDLPDSVDDDYIGSEIVGLCGPLLEVRSQHSDTSAGLRTVHLTHFSVKQYLLFNLPMPSGIRENERVRDEYQNTLLAKACLHYINIQRVWQEAPDHPSCLDMTFRDYAAASWHHHIKSGLRTDGEMSTLAIRFLDRSNHAWNGWRAWYDEQNAGLQKLGTESTSPGPLYYAVELELTGVATILVKEQNCDVNERNDLGRSALDVACAKGSKEVVKILLDANANISTTDKNGWAPLHSASENGHIEVVKLLIEKGASTTITDEDGWTPLHHYNHK